MRFNIFKRKQVKVDKDIYFKLRALNKEVQLLYKQKDIDSIREIISNSIFIKGKTALKIYKQCRVFGERKELGCVKNRLITIYNGIIAREVNKIMNKK